MRHTFRLAALAGAAVTLSALFVPAVAGADGFGPGHGGEGGGRSGAPVYVLTNDPTGNEVVTYVPDGQGALHLAGRVDTGGLGVSVPGAVVDKLASQGGLASDPSDGLLVGVNGGSDTISVFHAFGPYVSAPRVVASGGSTPVSVAVRGGLVYVLNAGGAGSIQGYYAHSLTPIPGSNQSLGLTPNVAPAFLHTPGKIGFTPDGRHLVVTEAATSALTTYAVAGNGTLTELGSITNGAAALCWVATNGTFFFGANAGSATVTSYTVSSNGAPGVVATTATDVGPVDLAASLDGRALYVETGAGDLLDSFSVRADGTLVATGSVAPELPGHSGLEGIAVGGSL